MTQAMTLDQAAQWAAQLRAAGRLGEAEGLCRQILAANPNHAETLQVLGTIAFGGGRVGDAVVCFSRACAVKPFFAPFQSNLGAALKAAGRIDEAIAAFQRAVQLRPDLAMAHNQLATVYLECGQLELAAASFRRATQLEPGLAAAHSNLGSALSQLGRIDEALAAHRIAVACQPNLAEAHNNLGTTLHSNRQIEESVVAFREAVRLKPGYAMAHNNLGNALLDLGCIDDARAAFHRALEVEPGFALAWTNLGNLLQQQAFLEDAIAAYRRALAIEPDSLLAHYNLGNALKEQGRIDEALVSLRHAIELDPSSASMHSNLLAALDFSPASTLASLFEEHCRFDERHAAPLRAQWRLHENSREPDRPLRLGFVSAHFAFHPVGQFMIRALENLDRWQFHVTCYSDTLGADGMTARFKSAAAEWRETATLNDDALAQRIREDRIDILFDLAGHTVGNRLLAFARKPAPIQITWLDYAGTTGLGAIDYLLADPREVPPEFEKWYREKILRLPDDYICYEPPADAPAVSPLPALVRGSVTFGSFNARAKVTTEMVSVWARLLQRVPNARLLLKHRGFDETNTRAQFQRLFASQGIEPARVELLGWSASTEVRAFYGEIDVALDTFPYNGGLTTCEALWMGVPVVTCPGETFASRHSLAHLTAAGFTETIARDFTEYVEIAAALATDLPRLANIRATLRGRVSTSPLCDGPRFATNLSRLLREAWQAWIRTC